MPYCQKCGEEVREDMAFCPKCGASLKAAPTATWTERPVTYRHEKEEKREKHEKGEKTEKREKHEYAFVGPVIGGLVLILIGVVSFLNWMMPVESRRMLGAWFLITIGVIVMIGAVYGAILASRRHPRP